MHTRTLKLSRGGVIGEGMKGKGRGEEVRGGGVCVMLRHNRKSVSCHLSDSGEELRQPPEEPRGGEKRERVQGEKEREWERETQTHTQRDYDSTHRYLYKT